MDWLKALLGTFDIAGFITRWLERRERDRLVVKAADAERAEKALEAAREANKLEDEIRMLSDSELDRRLRKFERKL